MSPPPGGRDAPPQRRAVPSRTAGRSELARHPQFARVSPEVGVLDEAALEGALFEDADAAFTLLADLVTATDERLRAAARRLAGRLVLDRSRVGPPRGRGVQRMRPVPADRGGDLDMDGSVDAIVGARAERRPVGLDELAARDWARPELALCLLVDSSGSMGGARLAAAALTAAACAWRAPAEHAVLAFAREVSVLRPLIGQVPAGVVVDAVLRLRGHGTTALAGALQAAGDELARSRAARRVVVLLSDCRATEGADPVPVAAGLDELIVLAPADDSEQAAELCRQAGARWAGLSGAADAPALLTTLLDSR